MQPFNHLKIDRIGQITKKHGIAVWHPEAHASQKQLKLTNNLLLVCLQSDCVLWF